MRYLFLLAIFLGAAAEAGINPASPGLPTVVMFGQTFDNNSFSAMCMDCHSRNPGIHTVVGDNTTAGSHFVYGGAALPEVQTASEKLDSWPSGGVSKYGNRGTLRSETGTPGELICESCHNLLINLGKYKTLAWDNETTDPSALCQGCHGNTGQGHHLLTGETSSLHGGVLSNADSESVRNPPVAGSGVTYPGPDAVNCRSCHTPHDAQTSTGARILKRGYKTISTSGDPVHGAGQNGMERQVDIDPSGTNRLVTDFTPLCDACHKASQ